MNAFGDEVEDSPAFHRDRRARVMRQHVNRAMVRRLVAPPAFPAIVGPRPTNRPEHVAPQDPGADILKAPSRKIVIGTSRPINLAEQSLLDGLRSESPFV